MAKKISKQKGGVSINPSESNRNAEIPEKTTPKEGSFRNVRSSAANENGFEDEGETKFEDQIPEDKAKSEKGKRT